MTGSVYVLGGAQSDFARNWYRDGRTIFDLFADTVVQGLSQTRLDPGDLDVGHVGNFVADLFTGQAQLGGFFGHVDPALVNLPASRHEAACASGSMALLAAMADIESGRYEIACVIGIEIMRNVPASTAAEYLRPAAWAADEWPDTQFVWPCAFSELIDVYSQQHGLDRDHLSAISAKNFAHARDNPNAQSRQWRFGDASFTTDEGENPTVSGHIRKTDCGQITDGAAVVFLASESAAAEWAKRRGLGIDSVPKIKGWGHVNAPLRLADKLACSEVGGDVFPHVRKLIEQTLARANAANVRELGGLEVHDCFNITEYMILDHTGLYPSGQIWRAIESGEIAAGGALPVNRSGGLIGAGHPVGATGTRMLLDGWRQVTNQAGDFQIENANNMMTINLGGSTTTCASFIVGT